MKPVSKLTGESAFRTRIFFPRGLATAFLTLVSGAEYTRYGGAAFIPMAILCAIALPVAWFSLAEGARNEVGAPV